MDIVKQKKETLRVYSRTTESRKFFFKNYNKGDKIHVMETAKNLNVSTPTIYRWIEIINKSNE